MRGCSTSAGEVLRRKAQRKATRAFLLHAICIPNLVLYAISLIVYFIINGGVEDDSR